MATPTTTKTERLAFCDEAMLACLKRIASQIPPPPDTIRTSEAEALARAAHTLTQVRESIVLEVDPTESEA